MKHSGNRSTMALGLLFALMTMAGCTFNPPERHYSSSVVKYLYSDKQVEVKPQIPTLTLPLSVGIAFVPSGVGSYNHLTEDEKHALMEKIAAHFKQYDYVKNIEIIPSAYLQPEGGFANLDQIRTMFGVDVIALVSYDQHQFTDEGIASLSYWTIVGAYIIPGEKNDTHTMVDTAVYDIVSRKLLFRAPGVSHIKGNATPVNISEALRKDRVEGFKLASEELITNLDKELQRFEAKVKAAPESYRVVHEEGYKGGGSVDAFLALLLALAAGAGLLGGRRRS